MSGRVPILIVGGAGPVGRVLLARSELDVRVALSMPEANAVLGSGLRPRACIATEDLASALVALGNDTPIVVCSAASMPERILDEIGQKASVHFAAMPRFAWTSVVEIEIAEQRQFLDAVDVGPSGIAVRGFPAARVGARCEVKLSEGNTALVLTATVARAPNEPGIVGLHFVPLEDEKAARLVTFLEEEFHRRRGAGRRMIPQELTSDLPLRTRLRDDANEIIRGLVRELVAGTTEMVAAPGWIARVAASLTAIEKEAALGGTATPWANESLNLRLAIARPDANMEEGSLIAQRSLEMCRTMGQDAAHEGDDVIAQVCEIRAALLRGLYGRASKDRIGTTAVKAEALDRWPRLADVVCSSGSIC